MRTTPRRRAVPSAFFRTLGVLLLVLTVGCDTQTAIDTTVDVTVLVVYTDGVAAEAPDVAARAYRAIAETNAVYDSSGVDVRLRVVGLLPVTYRPVDKLDAIAHLVRPSDGVIDAVHTARDEAEADVVVLLTEDPAFTQNAAVMATPETAFVLIYYAHAGAPFYNIAHEVGHLQGGRHQPERDAADEPFAFGHGAAGEDWRTVVGTGRGKAVVPRFSSPALTYRGLPLGDATLRDNVRVLNTTARYIANFRGPQRPTDFTPSTTFPVVSY